ncbi:hypothetical protein DLAC_07425 [Tieghemostelium lacteum]|uniref:Uncharacterized protein n=1 Tax=Tieghemostelium lacteum TaxID=361077 RepID=A0A151ZCH7_TIELA|nr:hypothetical protein DLAC_07425 [Tieghemostelium lacteum]|eukprot:KYQ91648.1 hypothetical protein DLAC_07425 [Tieghemostelium lacteum]
MNKFLSIVILVICTVKLVRNDVTPNYLWGIFYSSGQYVVSKYDLQNGSYFPIENYKFPPNTNYGEPLDILWVNCSSLMIACSDSRSLTLVSLEFANSEFSVYKSMQYPGYNYNIISGSLGYDDLTGVLYATAIRIGAIPTSSTGGFKYDSSDDLDIIDSSYNSTILSWDFEYLAFKDRGIDGLVTNYSTATDSLFNQQTSQFIVNLDHDYMDDYIYMYNISSGAINSYFISYDFSQLVIIDDTLYAVSEDTGFLMVYKIDMSGDVQMVTEIPKAVADINFSFLAFDEFIILVTDPSENRIQNTISILNTQTQYSKTYVIGHQSNSTVTGSYYMVSL